MIPASKSHLVLPTFSNICEQEETTQKFMENHENEEKTVNLKKKNFANSEKEGSVKQKKINQKRVRLRDYLFMANVCSARNKQKQKISIENPQSLTSVRQSKLQLRKTKYTLPNNDMHKIISNEITKQMQEIISGLSSTCQEISSASHEHTTKEDLRYLYEVRRVVQDKLRLAMKEIHELEIIKQQNVVRQVYRMQNKTNNMFAHLMENQIDMPSTPYLQDNVKMSESLQLEQYP